LGFRFYVDDIPYNTKHKTKTHRETYASNFINDHNLPVFGGNIMPGIRQRSSKMQ